MGDAERPTAEPITAVIADRVRALRSATGMSQEKLADKMRETGSRWTRATVANLERRSAASRAAGAENGRDSVSVQELLALALALDVPPVWLCADPSSGADTPVSPTVEPPDAWSALLWMIGKQPLPDVSLRNGTWFAAEVGLEQISRIASLSAALERVVRHRAMSRQLLGDNYSDTGNDDADTQLLTSIRREAASLVEAGFSAPPLLPSVLDRAAELGIDLTVAA